MADMAASVLARLKIKPFTEAVEGKNFTGQWAASKNKWIIGGYNNV